MEAKLISKVLLSPLLLLVTVGNAASAETANNLKWSLSSLLEPLPSVNLYKQFYEYVGAILHEGIAALNVAPLDPHFLNLALVLYDENGTAYNENYTNIVIESRGLIAFDFSDFDVNRAILDPDAMSAILDLRDDYMGVQLNEVYTTAVDVDGRVLQYNCSNVTVFAVGSQFQSIKQLEIDGTLLQVKRFDLEFSFDQVGANVIPGQCSGDDELGFPVLSIVSDVAADFAWRSVPAHLRGLSEIVTTVLNDIFALRNITDDDDDDDVATPTSEDRVPPQIYATHRLRRFHRKANRNTQVHWAN